MTFALHFKYLLCSFEVFTIKHYSVSYKLPVVIGHGWLKADGLRVRGSARHKYVALLWRGAHELAGWQETALYSHTSKRQCIIYSLKNVKTH